jgi:hypothetical protein
MPGAPPWGEGFTRNLFLSNPYRLLPMTSGSAAHLLPLALLLLAALPLCVAAASISALQGEDIPLGGTSSGSTVVYLFLAGPNLPEGGIGLDGGAPVMTGVPGSFTQVSVNTDGSWAYTWRTADLGRVLDPGAYVMYIAQEPRSKPDLDDTPYATQAISIGIPFVAMTPTPPLTAEPYPAGTMESGPLVTGMETPSPPGLVPGTPVSPARGGSSLSILAPLGAAALLLWSCRRG